MAKPTAVPTWATDAGATKANPTTAEKAAGWWFRAIIPFSFTNWFWNLTGQWLSWLNTNGVFVYDSVHEALDDMAVGDRAIVDEFDGGAAMFATRRQGGPSGGTLTDGWVLASNGTHVAMGNTAGGVVRLYARDDLTTAIPDNATITTIASGTIVRVLMDADYVYMVSTDKVEKRPINGFATTITWTFTAASGSPINDAAMDADQIYLVGANGITTSHNVVAIGVSDGLMNWEYAHGAEVQSVACDGRRTFIAGAVGTNSRTLRAIRSANGFDANGDGGVGTDTFGLSWDSTLGTAVAGSLTPRCLATDGRVLVWATPGTVGYVVNVFDGIEPYDSSGDEASLFYPGTQSSVGVALDDDWIYVIADVGSTTYLLQVYDRTGKHTIHESIVSAGEWQGIAVDGFAVWGDSGDESSGRLVAVNRRNRPRAIRKVAPSALNGHMLPYIIGR